MAAGDTSVGSRPINNAVIFHRGVPWRRDEPQELSHVLFHKTGAISHKRRSLRCIFPECTSLDDTIASGATLGTGTVRKRPFGHDGTLLRPSKGCSVHKPVAKWFAMAMGLCNRRVHGTRLYPRLERAGPRHPDARDHLACGGS